jgi:hypothetical protein
MSLQQELDIEATTLKNLGLRNYRLHYVLTVIAIAASFIAGISVALQWFGKDILAVVAAIPAAVLATADRLSFDAKTKWYYGKSAALKQIVGAITYEGLTESEANKKRTAIDIDFESRWPGVGASPR